MELKIIDKTDDEMSIEIKGEDHTFLNMLKFILLGDERVNIASYDMKHVSISDPILFVKTENADPVDVVRDALSILISQCDEFIESFAHALES